MIPKNCEKTVHPQETESATDEIDRLLDIESITQDPVLRENVQSQDQDQDIDRETESAIIQKIDKRIDISDTTDREATVARKKLSVTKKIPESGSTICI